MKKQFIDMHLAIQGEGPDMGLPTIMVRTSGCNLRCQFSDTDFCDAWMSSWKPEKPKYDLEDLLDLFRYNPQIKDLILTGGEPTMHKEIMSDLNKFCETHDIQLSIETNGTIELESYELDYFKYIIISPKMDNSLPRFGTTTPYGISVTKKDFELHYKNMINLNIFNNVTDMSNVFFKIVISGNNDLSEANYLIDRYNVQDDNVFLMPAGGTREELIPKYSKIMEMCLANGYRFSPRIHIIGYDDRRDV